MDIDLKLDSLQDYIEQLKLTVDDLNEDRDAMNEKVDAMNQVWNAPSYTSFRNEVHFITDGVFLQAIDDAIAFRDTLRRTKTKAHDLRKKANSIAGVLTNGNERMLGQETNILYYDDAKISVIQSTADSAETLLNTISDDYETITSDLSDLKTIQVRTYYDVVPYATSMKTRLQTMATLMSDFKQGIFELESEMNSLKDSVFGERFVNSGSFDSLIGVDGAVNAELAFMLFNTPEHLLTKHEQKLLRELKDSGYSLEKLIGSQGLSFFAGLGIAHDVGQSQFALGDFVYTLVMSDESRLIRRIGKGVPGLGIAFGLADAYLNYDKTYTTNPQLAERMRTSNAQVEGLFAIAEAAALEIGVWGSGEIGAAIGGIIGSVVPGAGTTVGAGVGSAAGTALGLVGSVAYVINADQIQSETIRYVGSDGTSTMDDLKAWWHDNIWKQK